MSYDRKTRQIICREHATKIVEIERSKTRAAHDREITNQYKQSDKCKKDNARRALQQKLDKANTANPENKIQNMLNFFNDTVAQMEMDYAELCEKGTVSTIYIIEMAKGYAAHIKIMRTFDEQTELDPSLNYSEKLTTLLEQKLSKLNPEFLKYVQLSTIDLLSL